MKKTKLVNVVYEIEIDEESQQMIEYIVFELAKTTGMTKEKSRVFVDLIIEMGFRRNRDPDITELLMLVSVFLGEFKSRLGSIVDTTSPFKSLRR